MAKRSGKRNLVLVPSTLPVPGYDPTSLVPENPRIKGIGFKLHWRPDTVIARITKALPAKVEQTVYLQIAIGYRVHPETLAKLLNVFRGDQELSDADMERRKIGPGLFTSRFDEMVSKVEMALLLIDKTSDMAEYMLSARSAAELVEAYGFAAEDILGSILENLQTVREMTGMTVMAERKVIGLAVAHLVRCLHEPKDPYRLTVEEMFRDFTLERAKKNYSEDDE